MNVKARNVLIGSILLSMIVPGTYSTLSVYVAPLAENTGASIGEITLVFSVVMFTSFIGSLVMGQLLKKLPVKLLVSVGGITFAMFFILLSFSSNLILIYIGSIFLGISVVFCGFPLAMTLINWWFVKNKAKYISFISISVGIGAFTLAPLSANMIENYGVQGTALIQGPVLGGLAVLIGVFLIAEHPSKYGLKPFGVEINIKTESKDNIGIEAGLTIKQTFSTSPFWLIMAAAFLGSIVVTGYLNNAAHFFQVMGLTAVMAAICVSIFSVGMLFWNFAYGTLSDKFGWKSTTNLFALISAIVLISGILLSGFSGAITFAILAGCLTYIGMIGALALPQIYGNKEAGNLIGLSLAAGSLGAMVGPPLAGIIYDITGTYNGFLIISTIFSVLVVIFIVLATTKKVISNIESMKMIGLCFGTIKNSLY